MKLRNVLRLAADNVMAHIGQLIGNTVMAMVLLLLIAVLVIVHGVTSNIRRSLEKSGLKYIDNLGYLIADDELPENAHETVTGIEGVEAATYNWNDGGLFLDSGLNEIRDIQNGNWVFAYPEYENPIKVEIIEADYSIPQLWKMELSEGTLPEELEWDLTKTPIYLGYQYKDRIAVGTEYESKLKDTTYVVAGILKKGQTMPQESLEAMSKYDITEAYPLDYGVIALVDKATGLRNCSLYFGVKDGVSFTKVKRKIMQKLIEAGCGEVDVINIGSIIASEEKSSKSMNSNIIQLIVLVGFTYCIVLICFQILGFISRQRDYGIMLAEGFSTQNIKQMILFENILKFFFAYSVSMLAAWWLVLYYFDPDYWSQMAFRSIYWEMVAPILAGVSILFVILATICPLIQFNRCSPVELMGKGSE